MKVENKNFKVCTSCVMDTSDSSITFDKNGVCDHCQNYNKNIRKIVDFKDSKSRLIKIIEKIKSKKNQHYDCLIGISGGVDSCYLAHYAKQELKLNPLMVHVDTGWNSINSTGNIEKIIDCLNLDLETIVIPWKEMKDLQLSFFKAQHPNLDIPQDHAIFASLYKYAIKNNIKYILNGGNFSTECIREPLEWAYHASDVKHIKDVHKKFGNLKLKKFPLCDIFTYKIYYRFFKGLKVIQPLNYIEYNKSKCMKKLENLYGWVKYEHKHYESRFTKFFEGYWLLKKFGYDKRKAHFSSLILTNQMTRDEAMNALKEPAYDRQNIKHELEYISSKLDMTPEELQECMNSPLKTYRDYKSQKSIYNLGAKIFRFLKLESGGKR